MLKAQDAATKIREIEQAELLKQQKQAVQEVMGAVRESAEKKGGSSGDNVARRVEWLTSVSNRIEKDGEMTVAAREDMTKNAVAINDLAWRMIASAEAGDRMPEIALKLVTIAQELGGADKDLNPKMLDTRARALFLLGKPEEAVIEQEKAVAAAVGAEEKEGFKVTLGTYRKGVLPDVPPPDLDMHEEPAGAAYILAKLNRIIIPSVEIEDATLDEVAAVLRKQSIDLDTVEPDPLRKGVNFVVQLPTAIPATAPGSDSPDPGVGPDELRVKSLHLRNVPLAIVLRYICDSTRLRVKVDEFSVIFIPGYSPEEFLVRTFQVPKDFPSMLASGSDTDPAVRPPLIDLLKSNGIHFENGSAVIMRSPGMLMVTNTPTELDKLEQLISAVNHPIPDEY